MTGAEQPAPRPPGPRVPEATVVPGPPPTPPLAESVPGGPRPPGGPTVFGSGPFGPGPVAPPPGRRKGPGTAAVAVAVTVAFLVVAITAGLGVAFVLGRDAEAEIVVEVLEPDEVTSTCALDAQPAAGGDPLSLEPARALDGDPATSWTCRADAATMAMTLTWSEPVELTEVGLLPGLDLFGPGNGADRWVQNRRVERVRWTFDDEEVTQDLDVDERTVQTVEVEATTTTVTLEVLDTVPGREIVDDEGTTRAAAEDVPVGEVEVRGAR